MSSRDSRVDAYIQKAQPFARPILTELRARVHAAVPGLEETIKWNAPFFLLDGRIFASMAGFKAHTKFLLWRADFKSAMPDAQDFSSLDELPAASVFANRVKASAATFGVGGAPRASKKAATPGKTTAVRKAAKKAAPRKTVARKKR